MVEPSNKHKRLFIRLSPSWASLCLFPFLQLLTGYECLAGRALRALSAAWVGDLVFQVTWGKLLNLSVPPASSPEKCSAD